MSFKHKRNKEENAQYVQKTYSLYLFPSSRQQAFFSCFFGVSRYLYNKGLELKIRFYKTEKKTLTYRDLAKFLTQWRKDKTWLRAVACSVEQSALLHLETAFKNFFRRVKQGSKQKGFPKFKRKMGRQSFEYPAGVRIKDSKIYLPLIGWLKYSNGGDILDFKPGRTTIVKTPTGKYYAQVLVKTNQKIPAKQDIFQDKTVGIDLGLTRFITLSNGEKIPNPKFFKLFSKKLRRSSRWLSRTEKGSHNRRKSIYRLNRVYENLHNKRTNFLHSLTKNLVNDNQVTCFKVESLNIEGMLKNHKLARSIQESAWGEFLRILEYKANWVGKTVERIPMFYPSSKLCSVCGYKNNNLTLRDRSWDCPQCLTEHDRDINAAVNIKNYNTAGTAGIASAKQNAHASGEGIARRRPSNKREGGNPVEAQK